MSELMRRHINSEMRTHRFLDGEADSGDSSRISGARNEQAVRHPSNNRRRDLVTKNVETFSQDRWELKLQGVLVFGFLAVQDEYRRLASPLGPMDVDLKLQLG